MIDPKKTAITIIGSGLAGTFLAVLLAQRGYNLNLYERLSQEEICDVASKRSYNIILYGYAIELLKKADLWDKIQPHLFELKGSVTHIPHESKPIITLNDRTKMPYLTITRATLVDILLKHIAQTKLVKTHFETSLVSLDRYQKTITVQNTKTQKTETISTDVVIGADGANSLVRVFLQQGQQTHHLQEYAPWHYKQFKLSSQMVEELGLEKGFEHTWTQKNAFIISHADKNHNLSALLVFPKEDRSLDSPAGIKAFFEKHFPELVPGLEEITESLLENPDGTFSTIHTDPWYYKDFMAIVGDAAHGFYPFFGQGTSAAFGDCMKLALLIDTYGNNWEKIFTLYQQERKRHMDTLGELSKDVMKKYLRYQKADFTAIYDTVERSMYRLFPNILYPPLFFSLITDPEHADDHWQNYLKQQKITQLVGITLFTSAMTTMVALYKKMNKRKSYDK